MIKIVFFFFIFSLSAHADHGPVHNESGFESEEVLRLFYTQNDFRYMLEIENSQKLEDQDEANFTLGFKYRLFQNLKVGLFYTKAYGQRYEEDWIKPAAANWQWRDTEKRGEDHFTLELSPRYQFSSKLVGELRVSYVYNDFNSDQTLKARPGLTYFLFNKGKPWFNFYLHHEVYQSLNFSKNDIYESWSYLGVQYFADESFLLGPYIATRKTRWASTKTQEAILGNSYNGEVNGFMLGFVANFYFP